MRKGFRWVVVLGATALVSASTLLLMGADSTDKQSPPKEVAREHVALYDPVSQETAHAGAFLTASQYATVYWEQVATYATARNQQMVAEWVAAHQPRPTIRTAQSGVRRTGSSGVTGACGGATNGADRFIQRESGGNPGVYNTGGSGAWGCYQLMPEHFRPGGSCSDMTYGQATPAQQAQCASRLPLSAWGG